MRQETDRTLVFHFEIALCSFLVVLAFLWRGHAGLVYPQFLFCVLALLAVNLGAAYALQRCSVAPWVSALIALGDCAAITAILAYSGGESSKLWILYALPIYTACLLLDARSMAWIAAGTVLFNVGFHAFAVEEFEAAAVFSVVLKSGILAFAAAAGGLLMQREKEGARKTAAQREELKTLSEKTLQLEASLRASEKVADLGFMSFGLARDIVTPLGAMNSAIEVLRSSQGPTGMLNRELDQISKSVRVCASLLKRFLLYSQEQKMDMEPADLSGVVRGALAACAGELKMRKVETDAKLEEGLPQVRASVPHLERAVVNLVRRAMDAMPSGGWLTLKTRRAPGDDSRVELLMDDTGDEAPIKALNQEAPAPADAASLAIGPEIAVYISRLIVCRHGGEIRFSSRKDEGTRVSIRLPAADPSPAMSRSRRR